MKYKDFVDNFVYGMENNDSPENLSKLFFLPALVLYVDDIKNYSNLQKIGFTLPNKLNAFIMKNLFPKLKINNDVKVIVNNCKHKSLSKTLSLLDIDLSVLNESGDVINTFVTTLNLINSGEDKLITSATFEV